MPNVLDKETAVKEITGWLDYKRVKQSAREKHQDSIDVLVDALMTGDVTIADGEYLYGAQKLQGPIITHNLGFPVGSLTNITYKPRETTGNLSGSIKGNESKAVMISFGSILSNGILPAQLEQMDSEDSRVLQAIVSFFL